MDKVLNVTSTTDADSKVSDLEFFGNPDLFQLLCKASSKSQKWMKSTKAMYIEGVGCLIQVSTQQGDNVAESLTFVHGVKIVQRLNGFPTLAPIIQPDFNYEDERCHG